MGKDSTGVDRVSEEGVSGIGSGWVVKAEGCKRWGGLWEKLSGAGIWRSGGLWERLSGAGGWRSRGLWERLRGGVGEVFGGVAGLCIVRMRHNSSAVGIWDLKQKHRTA